jgi:indole-3-glycerol phosphate synthase
MTPIAMILEAKRIEIARIEASGALDSRQRIRGRFSFREALARPGIGVIAEIKRASPSTGPLDVEPATLRDAYLAAGVDALSILTDAHFGMSADDLEALAADVTLPILRKDFILAESQIIEADLIGADAILLIAAFLSAGELERLGIFAEALELDVLYEVRSREEIDRLPPGAKIVGINNRDLEDPGYRTDLLTAAGLRAFLPGNVLTVAESGITAPDDVPTGFDAILVGAGLIREFKKGGDVTALVASFHHR